MKKSIKQVQDILKEGGFKSTRVCDNSDTLCILWYCVMGNPRRMVDVLSICSYQELCDLSEKQIISLARCRIMMELKVAEDHLEEMV